MDIDEIDVIPTRISGWVYVVVNRASPPTQGAHPPAVVAIAKAIRRLEDSLVEPADGIVEHRKSRVSKNGFIRWKSEMLTKHFIAANPGPVPAAEGTKSFLFAGSSYC